MGEEKVEETTKLKEKEISTEDDEIEKPELTKFGEFCQRHGINANLIMLKITLFVMYGATSSLLPYLTIHMQSIGLTIEEIAIIYLALPFTTFLSPPLTGFLVDKFGKYKPVVIMSLLLNAVFHHSLMMIPQQEIPGVIPKAYVMKHPNTGSVEVWWSPCPSRECPDNEELDIVVDQCLDHCLLLEQNPKIEIIAPPTKAPMRPPVTEDNGDIDDLNFHLSKRKPKDAKHHSSTPLTTSPTTELPTTTKKTTEATMSQNETSEEEGGWVLADADDAAHFLLDMHPYLGDPIEQLGMEIEQDDNDTVTDFKQRFGEKLLWDSGVNVTELEDVDLRCGGLVLLTNMSGQSNFRLNELAADCMVQECEFRHGGPEICPPDYIESDDSVFWIYFFLRFLATTMLSAGVTIMDPIALTMIEKYGGDFGRERLFSSFGMAIFSPITGLLIDQTSRGLGYTDYSAAFYTYDILLIISTITVTLMPIGDKLPADNVFRDLFNLLKLPHIMAFICFLFFLGNFWGFIESFLFLYLKELGAPNYLLGITITVGTVSSIPFLYSAEKITRVFGHVNLIIIAFFSHAVRLVGYSFIEDAWWCFPFEAMESLSCHLMWVAAATYCAVLAPKGLLATLIGVLGMAHFSLGRGSGSFFGGFLIGNVGTREAFRYMGLMAVFGGFLYYGLHLVYLKRFDSIDDKEDQETNENGEVDKLTEPKTRDQGTSMSQERLSLWVKYNQIGSLASLPRGSKADIHEHLAQRRSSYNIEYGRNRTGGSASKVDLLKSALEINHKTSHTSVSSRTDRTSNQSLNRYRADSAPKLNLSSPKSLLIPTDPVLEGVESNFVRYDRFKYRSRAQLQMIPADEPITTTMSFDAIDTRSE
ncbi:uncharacterized protein LOC129565133 isoform X3 [Sitodiplosis mosellana]|uniref:uncharacterized protein LOC129565133 isoform X3 n=1 Tax=Sitodiplosis mosellana TaxID=263140 RepID=UPI0024441A83|nr:uncharacterized protein LOC129565133 isoform X3 [Sitodiplosis mosellana]